METKFLRGCLFIFIGISSLLWGSADITHLLITRENNATPLLAKLLALGDVKEKNLQDMCAKTQANWIVIRQGQGGLERRDLVDGEKQKAIARKVFDLSEQLGLFSPYSPEKNHYDYAICLGAFFDTSKKRLEGLISLWNEGIRFDSLVFLGGGRLLREEEKVYLQMECSTEYDMLKGLWEMELNTLPTSMRESLEGRVVFVNAPRGEAARPSTEDTYKCWIEQFHPKPGSVVAMSSIGLAPYQHLVGKNVLGKHYELETVCPEKEMNRHPTVREVFDTVAKCLREIERSQG